MLILIFINLSFPPSSYSGFSEFEKAKDCFQKVLGFNHLCPHAYTSLGLIAFIEGELNESIDHFHRV